MDWKKYPNFSFDELKCRETAECAMNEEFMALLQQIRDRFDKPMIITSGYRSKAHSKERIKPNPGEHTLGAAVDVHVTSLDALNLVKIALICGIKRIGINQKGSFNSRYIHIGMGNRLSDLFPSGIWSY